jgi:23S rRNA (adenine2503-C2)-methyltransferase
MSRDELAAWLAEAGQPAYRATQILEWIYVRRAAAFDDMTNLPKTLRAWLAEHADIARGQVAAESLAVDETCKLLVRWPDDARVETVWIPEGDRHTACLSSQVGCPVGCRFCASGLDGLDRNLTAGEIVEQAWHIQRRLDAADPEAPKPPRLSNIVLMGMGEPLANYDAVMQAVRIINAPWGLNIGARKITLSTVGLPVQIRRLAGEGLQINLALSLHAAEEELRRKLIPWGKVPLDDLLAACAFYFEHTGREITFEYVLLHEVNMAPRHADQLIRLARRLRCNVNLLRYNPVPGVPYERPSSEAAHAFQKRLRAGGVNVHIRSSRGRDTDAACGQLRRRM